MLRIPAKAEKGSIHWMLPTTPEFADLLATVPEDERHGSVFRPLTKTGEPMARARFTVGPRFSAIGKAANVVTAIGDRKGDVVKEFASAHDLRRSFGFRWSRKVMLTVLRELMEDERLETTMLLYVGVNAEATADELWRAINSSQLHETRGRHDAYTEVAGPTSNAETHRGGTPSRER